VASFTSIRRPLNAHTADRYIGGSYASDKKFVNDIDRIDARCARYRRLFPIRPVEKPDEKARTFRKNLPIVEIEISRL